ncbi:hypothetical protein [Actinosynnema sp. NPDC023587]|uniref:hypothetical protein n=1 Tax=Actinosynnema sp. NPDC023587 TaxID=3154695 RepID=UPI0033EF6BEB
MTASVDQRPRPIRDAFRSIGSAIALLGSVTTSLVGWGILTQVQGDAVTGLLGAVPGAVTLVTTALAAFGVLRRAEPLVTPIADPRDDASRALVPADAGPDSIAAAG